MTYQLEEHWPEAGADRPVHVLRVTAGPGKVYRLGNAVRWVQQLSRATYDDAIGGFPGRHGGGGRIRRLGDTDEIEVHLLGSPGRAWLIEGDGVRPFVVPPRVHVLTWDRAEVEELYRTVLAAVIPIPRKTAMIR
jgi:hypothetical protein